MTTNNHVTRVRFSLENATGRTRHLLGMTRHAKVLGHQKASSIRFSCPVDCVAALLRTPDLLAKAFRNLPPLVGLLSSSLPLLLATRTLQSSLDLSLDSFKMSYLLRVVSSPGNSLSLFFFF